MILSLSVCCVHKHVVLIFTIDVKWIIRFWWKDLNPAVKLKSEELVSHLRGWVDDVHELVRRRGHSPDDHLPPVGGAHPYGSQGPHGDCVVESVRHLAPVVRKRERTAVFSWLQRPHAQVLFGCSIKIFPDQRSSVLFLAPVWSFRPIAGVLLQTAQRSAAIGISWSDAMPLAPAVLAAPTARIGTFLFVGRYLQRLQVLGAVVQGAHVHRVDRPAVVAGGSRLLVMVAHRGPFGSSRQHGDDVTMTMRRLQARPLTHWARLGHVWVMAPMLKPRSAHPMKTNSERNHCYGKMYRMRLVLWMHICVLRSFRRFEFYFAEISGCVDQLIIFMYAK